MPLSLAQLKDVCLLHRQDYKRCRYLAQDDMDGSKWYCLKKTVKKVEIDDETDEYVKECRKKNLDPRQQPIPLGDNCAGYPVLKHIDQGYDQK
jgi:hypothetical protein